MRCTARSARSPTKPSRTAWRRPPATAGTNGAGCFATCWRVSWRVAGARPDDQRRPDLAARRGCPEVAGRTGPHPPGTPVGLVRPHRVCPPPARRADRRLHRLRAALRGSHHPVPRPAAALPFPAGHHRHRPHHARDGAAVAGLAGRRPARPRRAGLQPIVLLGQFAVTLLLISAAARQDPDALRKLQRVYWPWVAVEAGLVVLFRLLPGVEHMFLQTVGGFFAGQNTVAALFGEHGNNVVDPAKSGGVFVNANVAAMFLGVNGLAALAVSAVTRTRWVRVVGVAALVAILFTGSKSATILALVLPAAAYGIVRMRRSPRATLRWQVLVPAGSAVAALLALLVAVTGLLHPLLEAFI